jgi:hypothetical protein
LVGQVAAELGMHQFTRLTLARLLIYTPIFIACPLMYSEHLAMSKISRFSLYMNCSMYDGGPMLSKCGSCLSSVLDGYSRV